MSEREPLDSLRPICAEILRTLPPSLNDKIDQGLMQDYRRWSGAALLDYVEATESDSGVLSARVSELEHQYEMLEERERGQHEHNDKLAAENKALTEQIANLRRWMAEEAAKIDDPTHAPHRAIVHEVAARLRAYADGSLS